MHIYCLFLEHVLVTIKYLRKAYLAVSKERVPHPLAPLVVPKLISKIE